MLLNLHSDANTSWANYSVESGSILLSGSSGGRFVPWGLSGLRTR
jgi:hypothetical protein